MASLFGSVATEVGGTIKDIAVDKRDDRRIDEEAQREMQLQKQRMQHDSGLLDRRIKSENTRAKRREEFDTSMFDRETERGIETAETGHGYTMEVEELRAETDIAQEYIKQYYSRSAQRSLSGNGWKVEFDREQVIDPTSPSGFRTQEYVNAQGPGGRPWKVEGGHAFYAGEVNPQAYDFGGDAGKKQAAEDDLYAGKMTAEDFKGAYGYIPSGYIFGQVSREDSSLQESMQRDGIRMPVWMIGSDDRRRRPNDATTGRTSDAPGPASGGASANSASAELRALAEREGRDPTPEETDEIIRKYREQQGLGEYPRGVKPGDMNSPYQSDFEGSGSPTEFGQQVLDSSTGALTRAADAETAEAAPAAPSTAVPGDPDYDHLATLEARRVEHEATRPLLPGEERSPAAPADEYVEPGQVPTGSDVGAASKTELTGELASDIADSIVSWFTSGYSPELKLHISGKEKDMMEAKYGKGWMSDPEAVAELREIQQGK